MSFFNVDCGLTLKNYDLWCIALLRNFGNSAKTWQQKLSRLHPDNNNYESWIFKHFIKLCSFVTQVWICFTRGFLTYNYCDLKWIIAQLYVIQLWFFIIVLFTSLHSWLLQEILFNRKIRLNATTFWSVVICTCIIVKRSTETLEVKTEPLFVRSISVCRLRAAMLGFLCMCWYFT